MDVQRDITGEYEATVEEFRAVDVGDIPGEKQRRTHRGGRRRRNQAQVP